MSFGFGVSDFIAVGKLAVQVYKRYKDSPDQYRAFIPEVRNLANLLNDLEHVIEQGRMPEEKLDRLLEFGEECRILLQDMNTVLESYAAMTIPSKLTHARLMWDQDKVDELRSRLTSTLGHMNLFYSSILASTTFKILRAVDDIVQDMRNGVRDIDTVSSLSANENDESSWSHVVKDLESLGISASFAAENRHLIVRRICDLLQNEESNRAVTQANDGSTTGESVGRSITGTSQRTDLDGAGDYQLIFEQIAAGFNSLRWETVCDFITFACKKVEADLTSNISLPTKWNYDALAMLKCVAIEHQNHVFAKNYDILHLLQPSVVRTLKEYGFRTPLSSDEGLSLKSLAFTIACFVNYGNVSFYLGKLGDTALAWAWAVYAIWSLSRPQDFVMRIRAQRVRNRLALLAQRCPNALSFAQIKDNDEQSNDLWSDEIRTAFASMPRLAGQIISGRTIMGLEGFDQDMKVIFEVNPSLALVDLTFEASSEAVARLECFDSFSDGSPAAEMWKVYAELPATMQEISSKKSLSKKLSRLFRRGSGFSYHSDLSLLELTEVLRSYRLEDAMVLPVAERFLVLVFYKHRDRRSNHTFGHRHDTIELEAHPVSGGRRWSYYATCYKGKDSAPAVHMLLSTAEKLEFVMYSRVCLEEGKILSQLAVHYSNGLQHAAQK